MSTFGKSTSRRITQFEALDNTPGPTAYDPAAALSLLNQDPNKHFGFIEKSNRWKSLSKDTLNEYEGHEDELMSSTGSRASFIHKKDHLLASHSKTGEKEEVAKLKKEMERLQITYEKQNTFHEKEMLMLGERCHKLDSQLQAAVKEKNSLASTTAKKDKEIDELMRKQDVLRSNLEKAERASVSLREKQVESGLLQKKVVDLSKKQEKLKSLAKSSAEVEAVHQELKTSRAQLASLTAEKATLTSAIEQLKLERKTYKTKSVELTSTLTSMKEEWGAREAKYKEESKEMTKRLTQQEEKLKAQKDDFKNVAEELYQKCSRQKKELEGEKSSFAHQKQAYLSRINELESDLEVTERGLIEKDRQLDQLRQSSISLQENTFKTEQSIHEYQQQLYSLQAERNELQARCADLEEKRRALERVSLEKEKEQAHFETVILSLQSTIDQYQAEHEAMVADHSRHIENKQQVISNLTSQLTVADQEMKFLSSELEEKKSELGHLMQSQSSLSTRLQEESQSASHRVKELESKLKDSTHQLAAAQRKSQEQLEAKQSLIQDLERKWDHQADAFAKEINMLKIDKSDLQRRVIEAQQALQSGQEHSDEQTAMLYKQLDEYREKLSVASEEYDALMNSKDQAINEYHDTIAELEARFQNEASSSNQKINDYNRKIARLQAEIDDLNHTIDENMASAQQTENTLRTDVDILEKSLQQHKLDLESMTMQYQQSQDTLRGLDDYHKTEKNSDNVQIQRLHREVSEKESTNEILRSQISELKLKIAEEEEKAQVAISNFSKSQSDLESRLSTAEHELKATVFELEGSQASYIEANQNVLELFRKLVSTRSDYYQSVELSSSLQTEVEFQKMENDCLKEDLKSCMVNLDLSEQQLLAERECRVALEALLASALNVVALSKAENVSSDPPTELFNSFIAEKMENLSLVERTSSLKNSQLLLQTEMAIVQENLKSSVFQNQMMQRESSASQILLTAAVSETLDLANNTWVDLQEAQNVVDASDVAAKQEKQISFNLREKVEELNGQLSSLQSDSFSEITAFKKTVESLNAELAASLENVKTLSRDVQTKETQIHCLEKASSEMTEELQRKEKDILQNVASITSLQFTLAETENCMAQLSERSAKTVQELEAKFEKSLQALKSENEELQQKLTNESVALADLNAAYVGSQKDISHLNQELCQEKSVVAAKADEIEDLLRRTQEISNDMSEMAEQMLLNEQTINELNAKGEALEKQLSEEQVSYQEEKSHILKAHADTERDLNETISFLTSDLRKAKGELDETVKETEAVKCQLASVKAHIVELEGANQEKENLCQSIFSDLSRAKLEHDNAILELKAAMDSQERQFNETKFLLQTEKTDAIRLALFEKEQLTEKVETLSAGLKSKERRLSEVSKLNEKYEGELLRIRTDGKQEFGSLQNQIAEIQAKHREESLTFEKTVQDMSARLAEKNNFIHRMQSELADAQNIVQRSDIRLSNEVSNRELMIKSLESKLREQKKELDRVQLALESSRVEQQKLKTSIESTAQSRTVHDIQLATKELDRENIELQRQLAEREHDESAFMKEIDKLQILLQEARQNLINEKENFDIQLQLLEQRGKLQSSEIKKIGDLNAELFGHSNTRQKIKHVAQLKEENMTLREQCLSLSRERDVGKRRVLNLERELESFRSVGLFNNRKMSRVGRSFQESSKHNQAQQGLPKSKSTSVLPDKENSLNMTGFTSGGVSFSLDFPSMTGISKSTKESLLASLRILILSSIFVLAFSTRLFSVLRFESIIHEFDPWFNYRTTVQLVEHGFYDFVNWFDELSWYPLGRVVGGTVYPGIIVTAGAIHWVVNALNFPVHIREVCVFFAPIFSTFTAYSAYLLTKELKNSSAGLLAAAFLGIAPGYISRSVAGSYDNEGIAIFLLVFTFYLWVKALKTGSAFYSTLTAIFYFYMVASWGGLYIAYSTFYVTGTLASMTIPFVGFIPLRTSEHMAALGVFGLLQIVAFTDMVRSHLSANEFKTVINGLVASIGLGGFGGIVGLTYAGKIAPFSGRFYSLWDTGYAKIHIPIIASVSEHQPTAWPAFFFDLQLLIAVFPAGIYFAFKELKDEHVFVILYAFTSAYFAGVMVRLMLTLTPIVCVAAAIAISSLLETYLYDPVGPPVPGADAEETQSSKKKEKSYTPKAGDPVDFLPNNKFGIKSPSLRYPIVGVMSVLLVMFAFHCAYVTSSAYSSPSVVLETRGRDGSQHIIDDFREAYYWLRENSDEKAKVLSWWDYGYQITGFSNRTVMVDNNTWNNTHIASVGKVMSCSEDVSYELMQQLDVDYVLVIFGGLIGYSGDDINKFLWMIRIGEGVYPKDITERKFFTDRGEYAVGSTATPTMKNSVMYKLSYYRFTELFGPGAAGRDNVRSQEIPSTPIKLTTMDEAYSTENLLVRIYKVKKPDNLGRPMGIAASFGKKRRKGKK